MNSRVSLSPLRTILISAVAACAFATPAFAEKYASIVVDMDTAQVLHARNADAERYPASLTKVMTLYMVFDALDSGELALDDRMKVSRTASRQQPSKLALKSGSTIRVDHAIRALVTKSANDVAVVIAEHLGGNEANFAEMMTVKARELGLTETRFQNASGLPDRNQTTTALDMAKLAEAVYLDHRDYYSYFSTPDFVWNRRTYKNHNTLLKDVTGVDGIKTGYINASGFNLVASVNRNGKRLIGVVFGGRTARTGDDQMKKLLEQAYIRLTKEGEIVVPRPRISPEDKILPADAQLLMAKRETLREAEQPGRIDTETVVTRLKPETASGWAIQVGAFSDQRRAQEAVLAAARTAPDVLRLTRAAVEQQASGTGIVYRARLLGFDGETEARAACAALRRENVACIPVNAGDAG